MKHTSFIPLLCIVLSGCATESNKTRPGATLAGADLPPPAIAPGPLADGDRMPEPIRMKNPIYPFELRKTGVTGTVVVEFIVDASGRVTEARAISSPHPDLSKAAVAAILQAEYKPGIRKGKPVATRMQVPLTFDL